MKKRIFCLILALVMVLSLAACAGSGNDNTENTKDTTTNTEGSEATTPVSGGEAELALITDANSIDDRGFNQFSWEGLKQYAEENGKTYTYYTPIDQSTQSYLSAIEGAVNNGAKLVVTPGFLFGEAIYKAQTMYPDVHFVLVDATPTLDDDTVIADNTFLMDVWLCRRVPPLHTSPPRNYLYSPKKEIVQLRQFSQLCSFRQ